MLLQESDKCCRRGEKADGEKTHQKEAPGEPKRQRSLAGELNGNQIAESPQQEEPHYEDDTSENRTETPVVGNGTSRIGNHAPPFAASIYVFCGAADNRFPQPGGRDRVNKQGKRGNGEKAKRETTQDCHGIAEHRTQTCGHFER